MDLKLIILLAIFATVVLAQNEGPKGKLGPKGPKGPKSPKNGPKGPKNPKDGEGPFNPKGKGPKNPKDGEGPLNPKGKGPKNPKDGEGPLNPKGKGPKNPKDGESPFNPKGKGPKNPKDGEGPLNPKGKGPKGPKNPKDGDNPGGNGGKGPKGPKNPKDGENPGGNGGKGGKGGKGGDNPGGNGGKGGKGGDNPGGNGGNGGTTSAPPTEQPSVPTVCNAANQGRCECGDESQGFTTYTFWVKDQQRCFTVYYPESTEPLPVMIYSQCYGKDKLMTIGMNNVNRPDNEMARRYGYARIGISSPDGGWEFGNNGVVNDEKPMPCSDDDSKDMIYARAIFDFIKSDDRFDSSRIWTEGFSQNSMFSAYIGFCFGVNGIYQGGSGMALTGQLPNLPGCQAHVSASDFTACRAEGSGCKECIEERPCTECQYWPIYPCYSFTRPVVDCLVEYSNDWISNGRNTNGEASSAVYMYDALVDEGHDARLLRFDPSDDGTIAGGHKSPQNDHYWKIGCLGVTAPCSQECEDNFVACVEGSDTSTAEKQAKAFEDCMKTGVFNGLSGCTESCAPTFGMLSTSQMPSQYAFENFGAGPDIPGPAPPTSRCQA